MHTASVRTAHARKGFTLVELIVALALVDALLLALIATTSFVVRELGVATARARALAAARARVERLASVSCGSQRSGQSASAAGLREWWSDSPASSATRVLMDSVEIPTRRGVATVVLRSRRSC